MLRDEQRIRTIGRKRRQHFDQRRNVARGADRLHEVDTRCARWLLQADDSVDGQTFALTEEFLSQMLGVHRPTVSIAAGMLQKAGLITYRRGLITITDRPCYRLIVQEYERLLGPI